MAHDRGKFTSRTRARKRAAEVLFEADQRGAMNSAAALLDLLEQRKTFTTSSSPLPEYAIRIVEGVAANREEIDQILRRHAKGAGIDRLPAFDLAVLRVAVWEMLANSEEVPPVVAIDEAVAVVKLMSTDDSPAFVNAVLDAARKAGVGNVTDTSQSTDSVLIEESAPTAPDISVETAREDAGWDEDELLGEY